MSPAPDQAATGGTPAAPAASAGAAGGLAAARAGDAGAAGGRPGIRADLGHHGGGGDGAEDDGAGGLVVRDAPGAGTQRRRVDREEAAADGAGADEGVGGRNHDRAAAEDG